MKCVVCKCVKARGVGRQRWVFSSDRLEATNTQVIFKLYDLTRREFRPGSVCSACHDLVSQADALAQQAAEVQRSLRARVNCHDDAAGSDGMVDQEDEEEELLEVEVQQESIQRRRRKRRKKSWSDVAKAKVKLEAPDYDEQEEEHEQEEQQSVDLSKYLAVEHNIKKEKEEMQQHQHQQHQEDSKPQVIAKLPPPSQQQQQTNDQENLDFNLTITKTTRGQEQLLYEGYTYLKLPHQHHGSGNDVVRWKCTSYYAAKSGCRARLHTTLDGLCVLLDSKTEEHNHSPPGERRLKTILFREQVRQLARNHPDMRPQEILTNARMLQEGDEEDQRLGLKDESLLRYIQRVRCKSKKKKEVEVVSIKPEEVVPETVSVEVPQTLVLSQSPLVLSPQIQQQQSEVISIHSYSVPVQQVNTT